MIKTLLTMLLVLCITSTLLAAGPANSTIEQSIIAQVSAASCLVSVDGHVGSGIVVRDGDGAVCVLTCAHVVWLDATPLIAFGIDGPDIQTELAECNLTNDLAVLRPYRPLTATPIPIAATSPNVGDNVFNVSAPHGFRQFACFGHVGAAERSVGPGPALLVLDFPATPGMSGSGLVDERGQLVGIVKAYLPETPIGLAVSLKTVRNFLHI